MPQTDISELEKRKLKAVAASLKEAVIILDTQRKITFFNKAAEIMTGYTMLEALGQDADTIIELFDTAQEISSTIYCPEGAIDFEGEVLAKNEVNLIDKVDGVHVVRMSSQKIKEGSLINVGCILILENVFNQSELERMKTDFMSMSVHLLRNPISIMHGYLGALLQQETLAKLNADEKDSLTSAVTGADELQDLVENLLNLTQIEQNIYTLKRVSFDLENLVTKTVMEFKALGAAKGIDITFIPSLYKIPMAVGDIGAVRTVLRNLIENAVKFTDQGKVDVTISLDGTNHLVSIKDTGPGIPASNLPMLFTKFYRVKSALEMQSSYGLGLYISKKIIELHKGKIWVESVEGRGSAFHFTIPADTSVKSTPVE